jgi:uncharacterized membrane protein YedE/YeeE
MNAAIALICGALFGAGVCISGMTRPSKVLGFLDLGGSWDPSLALVMGSALALHVVAWRLIKGKTTPRFGTAYPGPPSMIVDTRLIAGAVIFGIGWGISGFCPGPAIVSLASGAKASFVFVGAMAAAMLASRHVDRTDG